MTITTDVKVNTNLTLPFTHPQLAEGETTFSFMLLKDGEVYTGLSQLPVFQEAGNGLYTVTINFNSTGYYTVFIEGSIAAYVHAVTKDMYTILSDLDDVAQGSWRFDKKTGVMTMYRQNGAVLRTYNVLDNNDESSRELII